MKRYKILPEFLPYWTSLEDASPIVTEAEICRLSKAWGIPVEDLLKQVEEIPQD